MFMISTPKTFKVGDTIDCRINDAPQRLTWRDENTLVIEPDDARTIVTRVTEGDLICFICGDKGELANEYRVDDAPDHSGFVVSAMPSEILTPKSPRWNEFCNALDLMMTAGLPEGQWRCTGDRGERVHHQAKQVMQKMRNVDIDGSLAFFKRNGGHCDCEILFNVDVRAAKTVTH